MMGNLISLTKKCFLVQILETYQAVAIWIASLMKSSWTHMLALIHTCNPPGPDLSHTHTCFHVHTKILPAPSEDEVASNVSPELLEKKPKKWPLGNREAVRKYREKKKARAASLEDEVVRLRALNQQLLKRLQGQASLEAEIARLRCLLVDVRGRIEGEIGPFPYQKFSKGGDLSQNMATQNLPGAHVMNSCYMQCDDRVHCLHPGVKSGETSALNGQSLSGREFENLQCLGNQNDVSRELPTCEISSVAPVVGAASVFQQKRGARAAVAG